MSLHQTAQLFVKCKMDKHLSQQEQRSPANIKMYEEETKIDRLSIKVAVYKEAGKSYM